MWHFTASGKPGGPVSFEELARLANLGVINRMTDHVWCDGMANWTLISQIEDLYSTPPPLNISASSNYNELPREIRKTNYALFATLAIVASILGNIGTILYCIGLIYLDNDSLMAGIIFHLVSLPFSISLTVLAGMYIYRMWLIIQGPQARTTPGKAVGFLFIPLFNLYWMFISIGLWAKDYNRFASQEMNAPKVNAGLFQALPILACINILGFIPYFAPILSIPWLVIGLLVFSQICRVINHFSKLQSQQSKGGNH